MFILWRFLSVLRSEKMIFGAIGLTWPRLPMIDLKVISWQLVTNLTWVPTLVRSKKCGRNPLLSLLAFLVILMAWIT